MREMFDDDSARDALRTLTDGPAPPVTTTVDAVLRRGRRRVFAQRAGAVAGVVAVVAAIGATTVLLRTAGQPSGGGGVAVAATTPATPTGSLPGWETIPLDEATCEVPRHVPGTPPTSILPEERVRPVFVDVVESALGARPTVSEASWTEHSPKAGGPRGYLAVEIVMDNGNGQLQLEAGAFPGTPEQIADASLNAYGDCRPPARRVMPDGTVLQLFPADVRRPEQPAQHVQIYRPNGLQYVLTAAGWSAADMVPADGGGHWVDGGRGKLPVTEERLAYTASLLVNKLG
ncbi:hypothetical protein [Actinophytocola sp. NPDC049390]|uniref:hypothetical protein n=1 Tax=Actinophytocola sp. NPDC049390 TaxID=3363894 RepID=UPI0037AB30F3